MNPVQIVSLQSNKTSVLPWESIGMLPKGDQMLKRASPPTLSSRAGEAGNTGDVVHNLMDEVASLEDALLQMGTSSKTPFSFM